MAESTEVPKQTEAPKRLPLALSFVQGALFVLCLSALQVRRIRENFDENDDGTLADYDAYVDALIQQTVVTEDGKLFFEASPGLLFDPWYREVRTKVVAVYSPAEPGKNSPAGSVSPAP